MELNKQKEDMMNKDKLINGLRMEFSAKEAEYSSQAETRQSKLEDRNSNYQLLCNKYEILEKECLELVKLI